MLKIGIFSKLSRISVRMLRYYDEAGLLVPAQVDGFTGYRYYSEEQLMEAERINALREMGFGVGAVGEIMSAYHDPEALAQFLRIRGEELRGELRAVQRRLLLLENTLQRVGKDRTTMEYSVTLKEIPGRKVVSLRDVIPDYSKEGVLWRRMMEETAPQRLQFADPSYSIAIFHDSEYKERDVDVEVQMAVKGAYTDTENVRFREVLPQTVAAATCRGSYEQMGAINQAVVTWAADNGYQLDGPMFNIYHVGPAQTADPEQWVTEVCFPVAGKE